MKRIMLIAATAFTVFSAAAQTPKDVKMVFTEGSDLTIVGKLMDTPNPYHRVDTVKFKGFTKKENLQVRESSGLSIAFRTNSSIISVRPEYGEKEFPTNASGIAARGFTLYIKDSNGDWTYACSAVNSDANLSKDLLILDNMDRSIKECLLYLPLFAELNSVKVGTEEGSVIEPIDIPFRHRIGIFGSSYTHGSSTSRSSMAYPAQLSRMTGLQFLSLGCSGNCKLQPYFAEVLADAGVDALVFDAFSNPTPQQMEERLFPFIEKLQAAHPGIPLIFQRTIYRENRNFGLAKDEAEADKMVVADSLMAIACKKYNDVYYIKVTNADDGTHETSVDGIHPNDYGYTLWAESVRKPILRILKKYGIK